MFNHWFALSVTSSNLLIRGCCGSGADDIKAGYVVANDNNMVGALVVL